MGAHSIHDDDGPWHPLKMLNLIKLCSPSTLGLARGGVHELDNEHAQLVTSCWGRAWAQALNDHKY